MSGGATRALRRVLKEIEDGYATNIIIASVRRDGSLYTFATGEDPIRQLGALKVMEIDIISDQFRQSKIK